MLLTSRWDGGVLVIEDVGPGGVIQGRLRIVRGQIPRVLAALPVKRRLRATKAAQGVSLRFTGSLARLTADWSGPDDARKEFPAFDVLTISEGRLGELDAHLRARLYLEGATE